MQLNTNFANLTGSVAGLTGESAIHQILNINTITQGTHYFDGFDMFGTPSPNIINFTLISAALKNLIANTLYATNNQWNAFKVTDVRNAYYNRLNQGNIEMMRVKHKKIRKKRVKHQVASSVSNEKKEKQGGKAQRSDKPKAAAKQVSGKQRKVTIGASINQIDFEKDAALQGQSQIVAPKGTEVHAIDAKSTEARTQRDHSASKESDLDFKAAIDERIKTNVEILLKGLQRLKAGAVKGDLETNELQVDAESKLQTDAAAETEVHAIDGKLTEVNTDPDDSVSKESGVDYIEAIADGIKTNIDLLLNDLHELRDGNSNAVISVVDI